MDLLNECEQSLTANKSLVSKLPLVLYRGLKALARYVMSQKLTLRLLMSYIYIYMEHLFLMFLDHTRRRTTVGRTPLDE